MGGRATDTCRQEVAVCTATWLRTVLAAWTLPVPPPPPPPLIINISALNLGKCTRGDDHSGRHTELEHLVAEERRSTPRSRDRRQGRDWGQAGILVNAPYEPKLASTTLVAIFDMSATATRLTVAIMAGFGGWLDGLPGG